MVELAPKRGSEWRKWDLHIHTPASFYWLGGPQLKDMDDATREAEMEKFIKAVNESDVAVFCLMDYWTFDWYIALKEYLKAKPDALQKTIFPGIELRVECPVDYRLNIHCILSDNLSLQDLLDFKSELYIRSIEKKLSDDALIRFAKSLDASKAQKHGFKDPANLGDAELLKLGSKTAEITKDSLNKAFLQIPEGSGFIILPYDTSDGLLKLKWEDHPHDDNYFMQSADIFETRDSMNVDLISGKRTESNQKFFDNFFKTLGGKPKPCISGSDAHKYSDYGNFPSNKITWIKADTTFEGLKQIIYEPELRVEISPINPALKNKKFQLSTIKISHSTDFPILDQVIEINRDMIAIIGGRGSGKSALLESIAYCFDQHSSLGYDRGGRGYDSGRRFDTKSFIDHYLTEGGNCELQLIFKDLDGNDISPYTAKLQERPAPCTYPILYLGQNKIEEFASSPEEIHKLAFDTVLKNTSQSEALAIASQRIEQRQQQLNTLNKEIESLRSNIATFNLTSLRDESHRIDNELQLLTSEDTRTAIDEFNNARTKRDDLGKIEGIIGTIESRPPESAGTIDQLKKKFEAEIAPLIESTKTLAASLGVVSPILELDLTSFQVQIDVLKTQINKIQINTEYNTALQQIDQRLKGKTDLSVSYLESQRNRSIEVNGKIDQATALQKELETKVAARLQYVSEFSPLAEGYKALYQEAINEFYLKNKEVLQSIHLQSNLYFDIYGIIDGLYEYADKRKARTYESFIKDFLLIENIPDFNLINWANQFKSDEGNFDVFNGLTEDKFDELVFKNHYELITDIFYEIVPGDLKPLTRLSLGQKGTVLLKFYLSSGSNCPILIDQPEDHLDNDFIYKDLVKTIRAAKIKRQIIVVTHDANIVVNGDAEQVIIAQYNEQKISHGLSGSLENSKIKDLVSRILEGGEEAFKRREMKYSYNE